MANKVKTTFLEEEIYRRNPETGELEELDVKIIEQEFNNDDKDNGFMKIWLGHVMSALDEIGNKKMEVVKFMLEKMNKNMNMLAMTQQEIADEVGVSSRTVNRTIKALERSDFITAKTGVYVINPNAIIRGTKEKRLNVLNIYKSIQDQKEKRKKQREKENESDGFKSIKNKKEKADK